MFCGTSPTWCVAVAVPLPCSSGQQSRAEQSILDDHEQGIVLHTVRDARDADSQILEDDTTEISS